MNGELKRDANREINRITNIGAGVNLFLSVLKVAAGYFSGSMALIADGVHSLSDIATDIAVLLGTYFGSKEPDPEHPYGHGRLETFSTLFIAAALMVVGGVMIRNASVEIARVDMSEGHVLRIGGLVIAVAVVSIAAKEILYWFTRRVAIRFHSSSLFANAWHHRSDALSSVAVLVGLVSVQMGYPHGDQIATIAIGLMIILVGVKIVGGCWRELVETAVDRQTLSHIETIIDGEKGFVNWHNLRTRTVGREIFVDLHILVDPSMNICKAHEIAENLETSLHKNINRPLNVMVHVEPDIPEMRK